MGAVGRMGKFIKPGKVVVMLNGRYAGKKAVVVKCNDDGTKQRPWGHCLVVGVERPPLKVTKKMGAKKIKRRSRVHTFVKYVNYNHMMPTRYQIPSTIDAKTLVTDDKMQTPGGRMEARVAVKKLLQDFNTNPIMDKNDKPDTAMVFLSKKLRF